MQKKIEYLLDASNKLRATHVKESQKKTNQQYNNTLAAYILFGMHNDFGLCCVHSSIPIPDLTKR